MCQKAPCRIAYLTLAIDPCRSRLLVTSSLVITPILSTPTARQLHEAMADLPYSDYKPKFCLRVIRKYFIHSLPRSKRVHQGKILILTSEGPELEPKTFTIHFADFCHAANYHEANSFLLLPTLHINCCHPTDITRPKGSSARHWVSCSIHC
ncbi:hypothetical protein BDR06DRAFT_415783 [Suillus hirtellus]|nr:hypothetical protein BDR06DRAFT_415783 [Suillus hirtellus]